MEHQLARGGGDRQGQQDRRERQAEYARHRAAAAGLRQQQPRAGAHPARAEHPHRGGRASIAGKVGEHAREQLERGREVEQQDRHLGGVARGQRTQVEQPGEQHAHTEREEAQGQ